MCVIVKSFNKRRMKENMQIFDWELRDDELEKKKKKKSSVQGIQSLCN